MHGTRLIVSALNTADPRTRTDWNGGRDGALVVLCIALLRWRWRCRNYAVPLRPVMMAVIRSRWWEKRSLSLVRWWRRIWWRRHRMVMKVMVRMVRGSCFCQSVGQLLQLGQTARRCRATRRDGRVSAGRHRMHVGRLGWG